jgi:FkbM family methyltransferase
VTEDTLDPYSRLVLSEIREFETASPGLLAPPSTETSRVLLSTGPGPVDPYGAILGQALIQAGVDVAVMDSHHVPERPPPHELVVDIQDRRVPGLTRRGASIPAAVTVLGLTQMGSIRHDVVSRTRSLLSSLVEAALSLDDILSVQTALAITCDQLTGLPRRIIEVTRTQEPPYLMTGLYAHRAADMVIDVGAADGDTLQAFAGIKPPPCGYVAYEFDPLLVSRLRRRAATAHAIEDARVREVAVSDEAGTWDFVVLPGTGASHKSMTESDATLGWPGARTVPVQTVTLDEECAGRQPSLIKIDVEGAELAVLRGAARTLVSARPVLAIAAYHEVGDFPKLLGWLRSTLRDYAYHLRKYEYGAFGQPAPLGQLFLETVLYAVPRERSLLNGFMPPASWAGA